jgi:cytoskeletal protein RodZ
MTYDDPRPGGVHRRVNRGRRLRVLLISLVVVVLAGGGVEAALHWRGESKRPASTVASSSYPRVSPSATPSIATPSASSAVSSPADAPSPTVLTFPATSAPATPPPSATAPAATSSSASPAPSTSASSAAARPPVDILNSTHVGGMAARADSTLTKGGWIIALTGNYTHLIPTTVFYPEGQLAAAQALAAQFTAIGKTAPAPDGVSTTHLTLVLGQDWTTSGK